MSLTYEQRQHIRHQRSEHIKRTLPPEPGCKTCGAPYDHTTIGCDNCNDRARRRKRRNTPTHTTSTHCKGCGTPQHDRTPGCATCKERFARQRYRNKQ